MTVSMNTRGLDTFLRLLKESRMSVKVGILGGNASAAHPNADGTPSGLTVAEIGAIHEFGKLSDPSFPVRSFLRMPLNEKFYSALKSAGGFRKDVTSDVLKTGNFGPWLHKCGALAVGVIQEAFNTGGFGQWKPSQMHRKKNHATLIETGQLRNSITYEVIDNAK